MEIGEIIENYEHETGNVIAETFKNIDPIQVPGALVHSHAPFTWGQDRQEAVHNAVGLEEIAKMALQTYQLNLQASGIDDVLLDKHYVRKYGSSAYYGQ